MVRRLRRAPAEDEECNRRNGATGAVNSENIHSLSLRTLQPTADARITLQPKIAGRAQYKSRCIFIGPDFWDGLVKPSLSSGNHIEFILNGM